MWWRCKSLWMALICFKSCYVNIIGLIDWLIDNTFQKVKNGRGRDRKHNSHCAQRRKCTIVCADENMFWLKTRRDRQVFVSTAGCRPSLSFQLHRKTSSKFHHICLSTQNVSALILLVLLLMAGLTHFQVVNNKNLKAQWLTCDNLTTVWFCARWGFAPILRQTET